MARVARTRSRNLSVIGPGTCTRTYPPNPAQYPPVVTTIGPFTSGKEYCEDQVGAPWVNSPLYLREGRSPRILLDGVRTSGGFKFTSVNVPATAAVLSVFYEPFLKSYWTRSPIATSTLTSMALANMNPNRPDVDLPVAIGELMELPRLLKDSVNILRRPGIPGVSGSAKANLMAQFGILPIIRDIIGLFHFAESVAKREKYLRELSSGKRRIKRKLTEESWDGTVPQLVAFNLTASPAAKMDITGHCTRKYWFTAEASLANPLLEREIRLISQELVLGVHTLTAAQVWNLIPWSWLIDWFSDLGTILAAHRGGLKWTWSNMCIMYKTDYYITGRISALEDGLSVNLQNSNSHAVTKHRVLPIVSIYPSWSIPILTGRQWSILSSLAILRL